MRHLLLSVALLTFAGSPALAAATADSKACSAQATAKGLTGKDREAFRADCLKTAAPAAPVAAKPAIAAKSAAAPQSGLSKSCSADASAKGLTGKDRETFRAACMKGTGAIAAVKTSAPPMAAAKPRPVALPVAPAPAARSAGFAPKSPQSQACSDQATAKGLTGREREKFRDGCMKGPAAAAKPAARPAIAEAVPPEPRARAATANAGSNKPRSANQLASDQRIKRCGQMWQADKAAQRLAAGATWPKYWSACSARLKAA